MNNDFFAEKADVKSKLVLGENIDKNPILSIVIPTYKRIDLLRKNLVAILNQIDGYSNYIEVAIVSNDPEFDFHKLGLDLDRKVFRVYVNESNIGMCGNMNRCAMVAHGKFVSYIQDDDVLMPSYISTMLELILQDKLQEIDCLIPNRYYAVTDKDDETRLCKKSVRNMGIKEWGVKLLRLGRPIDEFQSFCAHDILSTTYQYFSGGPTCGMLFKKESLLKSGGFNPKYLYGFDYDFFVRFADEYSTVMFNKFLSVYIMTNSASNRPEVRFDFFRARYDSLENALNNYEDLRKNKDILHYGVYCGYPEAVRNLIDEHYKLKKVSTIKRKVYFIKAYIRIFREGGYRRKACPADIFKWYLKL